jgi:leucyl aminopeptidase
MPDPARRPSVEFSNHSLAGVDVDAVAVFAQEIDGAASYGADATALAGHLEIDLDEQLSRLRFTGGRGAVARIPTRGRAKSAAMLVVGLGEGTDAEALRAGAGTAARHAEKDSSLAVVVPGDLLDDDVSTPARAQATAEGLALGAYAYTDFRRKNTDTPSLAHIVVLGGEGLKESDVKSGVAAGDALGRATNLARDLVNTPPLAKRPPDLAARIADLASASGLKCRIHDEGDLEKGGFGGILGVGRGSSTPPRLVELSYAPRGADRHVVLVGKGITFDSGGLSLKPSSSMVTMKSDMAGAAAVVGAMSVLKELGIKTKVTGLCALAENMPGGDATRVSDVLTHRDGTTVEVMNTDAEGRLVLADALAYGAESEPDAMIDLATLTGAQVVALGDKISGLMGTDEDLLKALEAAAASSGERVWRLPLPTDYADHLKSEVADYKNIGKRGVAGALVAGLFLEVFAGDGPWAHLDIAGPAFDQDGDDAYTPKGGTGAGVRLLVRYLQG